MSALKSGSSHWHAPLIKPDLIHLLYRLIFEFQISDPRQIDSHQTALRKTTVQSKLPRFHAAFTTDDFPGSSQLFLWATTSVVESGYCSTAQRHNATKRKEERMLNRWQRKRDRERVVAPVIHEGFSNLQPTSSADGPVRK